MDQFLFAPSFLPVFFTMLLTLEGRFDKVSSKLHQEWWPTIKTNWIVWIPAQLINFGFVPGNLQVLFANVIGLFWNAYLSYVSHGSPHAEHEKQEIVKEEIALYQHPSHTFSLSLLLDLSLSYKTLLTAFPLGSFHQDILYRSANASCC